MTDMLLLECTSELMGLLRREAQGIANIGFESFTILVLYGGAAAFLLFSSGTGLSYSH